MSPRTLVVTLLLGATPVAAQVRVAPLAPVPRFGILAGLSSATLGGPDSGAPDRRNGFVGGIFLALPAGASGFALRPELLYVQKGASQRAAFSEGGSSVDLTATVALSYAELPVLLQYTVPTSGGLRPQLYAGLAFAVRTTCRVDVRGSVDGDTQRLSTGCGGAQALGNGVGDGDEIDANVRRFDVGGVAGGALAFAVAGHALAVGARYTHGFTNVSPDGPVKNRAVAVYGSLELPLGRRAGR